MVNVDNASHNAIHLIDIRVDSFRVGGVHFDKRIGAGVASPERGVRRESQSPKLRCSVERPVHTHVQAVVGGGLLAVRKGKACD